MTKEGLSGGLHFITPNCASIPPELDIMVGDVIADARSTGHGNDLVVRKIEADDKTRERFAHFGGTPFPDSQNQQLELVRRLGEPHDLYSLGALFYYVLSEKLDAVRDLRALVQRIKVERGLEMTATALAGQDQYRSLRDHIPEKFWQDDLLVLILRAMVRGRKESLVESRVVRDSGASRVLLHEIRRIHRGIYREVLAARDIVRFRRLAVFVVAFAISLIGAVVMLLLARDHFGASMSSTVTSGVNSR
jgi:hypothetical protein